MAIVLVLVYPDWVKSAKEIGFSLSYHQTVNGVANADKFRKGMKKAVPNGDDYKMNRTTANLKILHRFISPC